VRKKHKGVTLIEVMTCYVITALAVAGIICMLTYTRASQVKVREYGRMQTVGIGLIDQIQADVSSGVDIATQDYSQEIDGITVKITIQAEAAYGHPLYYVVMDLTGRANVRIVTRTYMGGAV